MNEKIKKAQQYVNRLVSEETDTVVKNYLQQINEDLEYAYQLSEKREQQTKLQEQATAHKEKQFELNHTPVQKHAVNSKLMKNWNVNIETPNKIKVKFLEHATKRQVDDSADYSVKMYVKKLQAQFPELMFESFKPAVSIKGMPTTGRGDYLVEFIVKYDKKRLF